MHNQRDSYPTFVVPALGSPQGKVGRSKAAIERFPGMIDSPVLVRCGHAAVVGGEDNDGVIGQPKLGKLGPDSAEAFIGGLEHSGELDVVLLLLHPPNALALVKVHGVVFLQCLELLLGKLGTVRVGLQNKFGTFFCFHGGEFLPVLLDKVLTPLNRIVHRKVLHMDEERAVLVTLDEVEGGIGKLIGVVVTFLGREGFGVLTGEGIVIGAHPAGNGFVEPIGSGVLPQMRLAIVRGGVAVFLQGFRQGDLLVGQGHELWSAVQLLVIPFRAPAQPFGQVGTGRVLARQDACPARRADVTGRVCIVEEHTFLGQLVDRRSFMKLTAIATHVRPTKIVDQKKDDVGLAVLLPPKGKASKQ